jgi:hypothetical protein
MATATEQLAAVEAAIDDLLAGKVQSYSFAGRQVSRLDIAVLFRERERLTPLAAREAQGTGGGLRQRGGFVAR